MRIRSFQLSDVIHVQELLQIALSEECYEDTRRAFTRQLSYEPDLIMVAEVEENIVGALIGTIDQSLGCIYRVAVHPDHRRQGVGKTLVQAMEQRFEQRNVNQIVVAGDEYNKVAMPLYEALGYKGRVLESFNKLSIAAVYSMA